MAKPPGYYAMSVRKLVVMDLLLLNAYSFFFWWQQWTAHNRRMRSLGQSTVTRFWYVLFAPFTFFEFSRSITMALTLRDLTPLKRMVALPIAYMIARIASRFSDADSNLGIAVLLVSMVAQTATLGITQGQINRVLEHDGYQGPVNDRWEIKSLAAAPLGVLIWLLALAGYFLEE